jgi:hypothetical protein
LKKFVFLALLAIGITTVKADVNLRIDPLAPLVGMVGIELDFPISKSWTLGPQLRFLSREDSDFDVTGYGLGLRANYWFNRPVFTQGWYFGPSINFVSVNVKDDSGASTLEGDANGLGLTAIFGYQWMWDSFNINLGLGPSFVTVNKITIKDKSGNRDHYNGFSGVNLALEFTLGWKF